MRWSIDKAKVAWHAITWCQHTPRAIKRERRRPIGCRMGRERSNTCIAIRTRLVKQILITQISQFTTGFLKHLPLIRLLRYSRCFVEDNFASAGENELASQRPPLTLWDRTTIWKKLPEISYAEFMESERGLALWLEMFHRFGIALLRGVPTTQVGQLLHNILDGNWKRTILPNREK